MVNTASLGGPQARERGIHVSGIGVIPQRSQMAMVHILDVSPPLNIDDRIDSGVSAAMLLPGEFNVARALGDKQTEPLGLGYIRLGRHTITAGASVRTPNGAGLVARCQSGDKIIVFVNNKRLSE